MNGIQRKRRAALLTAVLALLIAVRVIGARQAQERSLGTLKEQQLIDRSALLLQTVASTAAPQILTVEYSTPDFYSISGSDSVGNEVASVTWDVHQECVCRVTCNPTGVESSPARLNAVQVVRETSSWLRSLGIAPDLRKWRSVGAPIAMPRHRWAVKWTGEGRRVIVQIDDRSGALYLADVRQ